MGSYFEQTANHTHIATSAGAIGPTGTGAYTMARLFRPANIYSGVIDLASGSYNGTEQRNITNDGGVLFGANNYSAGGGTISANTWYSVAQSKPAGSNPYRWHYWPYAADGSGTKTHANSSTNFSDGSTIAGVRLGDSYYCGWGDFALWAVWNRALSDADFNALCGNTAQAFMSLGTGGPDAMWLANVSNPANIIDVTSNGANVITVVDPDNVISVGADPPSFNYSIGFGGIAAPWFRM